ncbi:MAG: Uncharacterized MFS-type transporter [uncultured Nocardioidaceae bacterium]|uniref:Uncharacterized MFS-type transporter n=1 Tax=uncultured Nocardioidaceae bacterium TaxID=253824 RepID=A0A6J4MIA3_9ACTN|nr:MAG: Uncharacterized MFS-type transporter [uncultured Nocardioidaceae bacterium]
MTTVPADGRTGPDDGVSLDEARGRWVLFAAVLGSSLAMLDATVVNIALPEVGADLGAEFSGLQWTVNGYTLTLAALILLGGSLGDRFGRRRVFVLGTVWFAVASLLCGLAPNVEALVAARMLQGVGGALLTPGSLALIQASFRPEDRARAIGAWSGLGGVAAALGPFLGGTLVEISWRLIFLVNLPFAVLVVVVARRHVPESSDAGMDPRIDVAGAGLGAVGLGGLTYGLIRVGEGLDPVGGVALALGVIGLVAFVAVERRSSHPMLPTEVFASRQFTAANLVTFLVYAALGGVFFLLVLQLQIVSGFTPLAAGVSLLPVTAAMLVLSGRAGALTERIGPRLPMTAGPLVCAVGLLLMLRIGAGASYVVDVLPAVLLFGLGLSLTVAPLTATVLAAAPTRHAGVASGVNNAVARAAGLVAVAGLPVLAGISGDDFRDPTAFGQGFQVAMLASALLLVLGGVLAALTISNAQVRTAVRPARTTHCSVDGPPLHASRE